MNPAVTALCGLVMLFVPLVSWAGAVSDEDGTLDYIALGASDAFGIGATPLNNGYVYLIRDALAARGLPTALVNLGIPGATIERVQDAAELFLISNQDADLITLWAGPNDVTQGEDVEGFEEALAELLAQLREETDAFIVIANVPNLTRLPRFMREPDTDVTLARVYAFNQAIRQQATEFDVPIINLFEALNLPGNLISDIDGFHPNDAGHARVAELFLTAIVPAF